MNLRSRMRARSGGVAERLIAPVLKTGRPKGLVSSNLTPSASLLERGQEIDCITESQNNATDFQWCSMLCAGVSRISVQAGQRGSRSNKSHPKRGVDLIFEAPICRHIGMSYTPSEYLTIYAVRINLPVFLMLNRRNGLRRNILRLRVETA